MVFFAFECHTSYIFMNMLVNQLILRVYVDASCDQHQEVPITPDTTCAHVLEALRPAGSAGVSDGLVELWRGCERPVRDEERLFELLQQWGIHRAEVKFFYQTGQATPTTAQTTGNKREEDRRINGPDTIPRQQQMSSALGNDMTLAELQEMASRQQQQIESQEQALAAREQRLRLLRQHEAKHVQQMSEESSRVRKLRESVDQQELKLRRLRALRGQLDTHNHTNHTLASELESIRSLFGEKQRELATAVARVEQLSSQLEQLKLNSPAGTSRDHHNNELERLKHQLIYRTQVNEQQSQKLAADRELLKAKQQEMLHLDKRIDQLTQRLRKKRDQIRPHSAATSSTNTAVRPPARNQTKQTVPSSIARDDLHAQNTGFVHSKNDPMYQTLPPGTKFPSADTWQRSTAVSTAHHRPIPSAQPQPSSVGQPQVPVRPQKQYRQVPPPPVSYSSASPRLGEPRHSPQQTDVSRSQPRSRVSTSSAQNSQNQYANLPNPSGLLASKTAQVSSNGSRFGGTASPAALPATLPVTAPATSPVTSPVTSATTSTAQQLFGHVTYSTAVVRSSKPKNSAGSPPARSLPVHENNQRGGERVSRVDGRPITSEKRSQSPPKSLSVVTPPRLHPPGAVTDKTFNEPPVSQSSPIGRNAPASKPTLRLRTSLREQRELHVKKQRRVSFDPLALLLDASLKGELQLVQTTAEQVDDVSAPNDEGITALHNAICAGYLDIVQFLVEFGCNVNSPDADGWTPLHCAASCNHIEMVRFLVEHGACIFAATVSDQRTASQLCEQEEDGFEECEDYLTSVEEKLGVMNNGAVYALYDYEAHNSDEIGFNEGDMLLVLRKGDEQETEWWWCKLGDRQGYVPRNLLGLHPRVTPRRD